jgi:hypothetical protein
MLGAVAVFIGVALFNGSAPFSFLPPIMMIPVGYFIMKKLIFDLLDEVDDDGDALIVRNGGRSDRVALSDIMNVNYSPFVNPPRVTLTLRKPSVFGDQISFCAPLRLIPFSTHPLVNELIRRIDASRGHAQRTR